MQLTDVGFSDFQPRIFTIYATPIIKMVKLPVSIDMAIEQRLRWIVYLNLHWKCFHCNM